MHESPIQFVEFLQQEKQASSQLGFNHLAPEEACLYAQHLQVREVSQPVSGDIHAAFVTTCIVEGLKGKRINRSTKEKVSSLEAPQDWKVLHLQSCK